MTKQQVASNTIDAAGLSSLFLGRTRLLAELVNDVNKKKLNQQRNILSGTAK